MTKYNTSNELLKKQYEAYLSLNARNSQKTVDSKIADLRKYEEFTGFKGFGTFNEKQALCFKEAYKKTTNTKGEPIDFGTIFRTLRNVGDFFLWLSSQPGYKRKVNAAHVRAFNLTTKEENIAKRKPFKEAPTVEQIEKVLKSMPTGTPFEKRNQAIIAFTLLTAVRIEALISLKVGHVDEYRLVVRQDPKDVKTKFSKQIVTAFFPVGDMATRIVLDWVKYLKEEQGFMGKDPLFPAMQSEYLEDTDEFKTEALSKRHIVNTNTARVVFKNAFEAAGQPYFNPHSFRNTITQVGERICQTPEEFKVWSQNLGHSSPLTTFTSYGEVPYQRQCNIIRRLGEET